MRTFLPAISLLFAMTAAAASAADPATAPTDATIQRAASRQKLFDKIDTNHDGVVSRSEYLAFVDSRFDRLDGNADGQVSAAEVASAPATAERAQQRAERFVRRYDASGDGEVSKADFEARAMRRFDRLSGGTDVVTEQQFAARAAKHRPPAPGPAEGS